MPEPAFAKGEGGTQVMKGRLLFHTLARLALGGALVLLGSLPRAQAAVVRTLVYHQITALPKSDPRIETGRGSLVLSRDGSRAAFTTSTRTGNPITILLHIWVVKADGTEPPREVDVYPALCDCGASVDISADGAKVVSTDGGQLRVANTGGGGAVKLGQVDGTIVQFRVTPDGSKVFFQVRADTAFRRDASSPAINMQRGVWRINADGSGLQQVAGPDRVATVVGRTADKIFTFDTNGPALGVSSDGARIVFGTHIGGEDALFACGGDGGSLRRLDLGRLDFINHAGISADGSTVFYDITPPPCCSTPSEAGVINFDGSNRRTLIKSDAFFPFRNSAGYPDGGDLVQLSDDGSKLLLGTTSILFDTTIDPATGKLRPPLQLGADSGGFTSDSPILVGNGLFRVTMNGEATRFLYISGDADGVRQLATLDLNPARLGGAPSIGAPKAEPASVRTDGRSNATVSAQVSVSGTIVKVSYIILRDGLRQAEPFGFGFGRMFDDGTHGDAVAGDGIFTSNELRAGSGAVVGPYTVRIKVEARASADRLAPRHATAVDIEPFAVTP